MEAQRRVCLWSSAWTAVPESVPSVRHWILDHARGAGAGPRALEAIGLAASEAATNAVLHAFHDKAGVGEISVSVELLEPGLLRIVIADNGTGMRPRYDTPGLGLGLSLITHVAEHVHVATPAHGGTQVRMDFALAL